MHAGADAHALQGALPLEALADAGEHGHVAVGPHNAGKALVGQRDVFDVVVLGHGKASLGMENGTVRPLLYASAHAFTSGRSGAFVEFVCTTFVNPRLFPRKKRKNR